MSSKLGEITPKQEYATLTIFDFFENLLSGSSLGPFSIRLWNGAEWCHGDADPRFTLFVKHPSALRRMFWRPSELSLGEAYIFDDFDISGNLEDCFELADHLLNRRWPFSEKLRLGQQLLRLPGNRSDETGLPARLDGLLHSRQRDAQAVRYHYDVSNEFYRIWLDRRMVYSCAFFHDPADGLDQAQRRKLDYICRKLRLRKGERLLDIGCGWGALLLHAAENFGVEALGITLSQAQADLAREHIRAAGLENSCRVEICDYRDIPEAPLFDKVVSVGMFEHVGEAKLPEYFRKVQRLLRPGGVFLNHGITQAVDYVPPRASFIDKYVFPDGELLPVSTSLRFAEEAGFEVRDVENLREHYAMTLRHWVERLDRERERAIALTSQVTYRIWRIYMAGSAYGFKTGRMGLHQALLVKSGERGSGLPLTRCDWYRPCPEGRF